MKTDIETILRKIEKIAEEKAEEIERKNYEKYKELFEKTAHYLKRQKVLLYGGYALNDLLPTNLKIYKEEALPDIDFFSYEPKKIAIHLVKSFRKDGFHTASFSEALHPGTYKVFVHGLQVADITGISKASFQRLAKNSVIGASGIAIVDPQYLRMSLHMLMSQAVDSHRWSKVFKRLISFYKVYPPKRCSLKKPEKELPREIVNTLYEKIQRDQYVLFGARELQLMHDKKDATTTTPEHLPAIQILVDADPEVVATNFMEEMKSFQFTVKVFEQDDFIPKHAFLIYKKRNVLGIYAANACMTYVDMNQMRIASIHTMLRMYLSMALSTYSHFTKPEVMEELECITSSLSYLQQKTHHRKRKVLQEFLVDCYGTQPGLITLRREKFMRFRENS